MLDDKDIDAVVIATPNHWHALATIWALQAGKHVYVEKPSSHTVWEGRKMVEAAAKYNKIVQVGTMNRSRPAVQDAIKFIHEGGIGKVYMARGLCFKRRAGIGKYPDGPMAAGEKYKLNIESRSDEAAVHRRVSGEGRLRPVARSGAEAAVQPQPLPLQLALALGLRQRRHRQPGSAPVRHRALGPAEAGAPGEDPLGRRLLRRRDPTSQETPDLQTTMYEYADGKVLEFGTRGGFTNAEGEVEIGNLFYGTKGWLWIDGDGRKWQSYLAPKNEKGPGANIPAEQGGSDPRSPTSIEYPHYAELRRLRSAPAIRSC